MNFSDIKIPSNRKFGFFFTFVFVVAAGYSYYVANMECFNIFVSLALVFLLITLIKSVVLLPLNKLWMGLGFLLGKIVSPIILGIIFLGLFTPIAILMRFRGRDELRLKLVPKATHWRSRNEPIKPKSFINQF